MKAILIAALLALLAGSAKADEIYSYTGPQPSDLSGSFTTAAILAPNGGEGGLGNAFFTGILSWSFTDGVDAWTPANSVFGGTAFINPDGSFLFWGFGINSLDGQNLAYSQTQYGSFYYQDHTPVGDSWVANQLSWDKPKGSWTMADPVPTPEPETLALVGLGLAALTLKRRKPSLKGVWEPLA